RPPAPPPSPTRRSSDLGGFEHLCLPAEYEPTHPFVCERDPRSRAGELLWPERFGCPVLERLKRSLGSFGAAGQLQQRPAPAGGGDRKSTRLNSSHQLIS